MSHCKRNGASHPVGHCKRNGASHPVSRVSSSPGRLRGTAIIPRIADSTVPKSLKSPRSFSSIPFPSIPLPSVTFPPCPLLCASVPLCFKIPPTSLCELYLNTHGSHLGNPSSEDQQALIALRTERSQAHRSSSLRGILVGMPTRSR